MTTCRRAAVLAGSALLAAVPLAGQTPSHADLAFHWAPIHHQDVDPDGGGSLRGRSDFLSAIDFDGDWHTINNWENAATRTLRGVGYYSVVETVTHWFIVYAFYHPRDWSWNWLDTHENDLEGLLTVVRKPSRPSPQAFGTLEAVITVFHLNFYSYVPPGSRFRSGRESVDGQLRFAYHDGRRRFVVAQESGGHGLKAWPYVRIRGGDGVVYMPSRRIAAQPRSVNDRNARYRLVDIFAPGGMWARRFSSATFARFGVFRGDDGPDNKANAPWKWDDRNDGSALRGGELAVDPAKIVSIYFSNKGSFSRTYVHNPYLGIIARPGPTAILAPITLVPRHVRGDRDFHGNGPRVVARAAVRIAPGGRTLQAYVSMYAAEWDGRPTGDRTTASGSTGWRTVFTAPPGRTISRILTSTTSSLVFVDRDHATDLFDRSGHDLVQRYAVIGDTRGDEAGTRTRVTVRFNPVRIQLR